MHKILKYVLHLLAAVLVPMAVASCADISSGVDESAIVELVPTAGSLTKAPIDGATMPSGRTLKVSAYHNVPSGHGTSTTYFTNTTFSNASSRWRATNTKYWPGIGTLDIFAYSADGLSAAGTSYTPTYHLSNVAKGATITVADNSSVQSDILFGRVTSQTRNVTGNGMPMYHAQALVVFTAGSDVAYNASTNYGITIRSITLRNVKCSGTLAIDATQSVGSQCTWTGLGSQTNLSLKSGGSSTLGYDVPRYAMDITAAGNHMGIGGTGLMMPEQAATSFVVEYTLHNGKKGSSNIDNNLSYVYTCSGNWEEGRKYVYNLSFSGNEILCSPSVTVWGDGGTVQIPPDPANGHDYVEIGGMKWATMNVGAESVTDYGLYFQWGDVQGYTASQVGSGSGQKFFGWTDYKYGNGTATPGATQMAKYNSTDGKTVLDLSDDGVNAAWGGNWRMPTTQEFAALGAATNRTWTTNYQGTGVHGMIVTDKTDSSKKLFFPAAGYAQNGSVQSVGNAGAYWSSSLYSGNADKGYGMYSYSSGVMWQSPYEPRSTGYPLRGVLAD